VHEHPQVLGMRKRCADHCRRAVRRHSAKQPRGKVLELVPEQLGHRIPIESEIGRPKPCLLREAGCSHPAKGFGDLDREAVVHSVFLASRNADRFEILKIFFSESGRSGELVGGHRPLTGYCQCNGSLTRRSGLPQKGPRTLNPVGIEERPNRDEWHFSLAQCPDTP
jgi:hypothetical protein